MCQEGNFGMFVPKHKLLILSRLSDFMTCSERFNIQSGVHISALEHCSKIKLSTYVHHTLMYTNCKQCYAPVILLEKDIIIRVGGIYISALETVGR